MFGRRRAIYGRRRRGGRFAGPKEHTFGKKDIAVKQMERKILGANDVSQPTRNINTVAIVDGGLRLFGNGVLDEYLGLSTAEIGVSGFPTTNFGATPKDVAALFTTSRDNSLPIAIGAHYETYEICNINSNPILFRYQVFKWKNGANYQGVNISSELATSSMKHMMYMATAPPAFSSVHYNVSWKTSSITNLSHMNVFGHNKSTYARQLLQPVGRRVSVMIPPGGVLKIKVYHPRLYPVFKEDLVDLAYAWKGRVDRTVYMEWKSLCGVLPKALGTDPGDNDIHTEKPMIAMTRQVSYVARVYYKFNVTNIYATTSAMGPTTDPVPAKSAVTRAEKPNRNIVFEPVAQNPTT